MDTSVAVPTPIHPAINSSVLDSPQWESGRGCMTMRCSRRRRNERDCIPVTYWLMFFVCCCDSCDDARRGCWTMSIREQAIQKHTHTVHGTEKVLKLTRKTSVRPSFVDNRRRTDALGAVEDKRSHLNAASAITINNRRPAEEEATVTCHGRNAK